jgi:hypothetical protein
MFKRNFTVILLFSAVIVSCACRQGKKFILVGPKPVYVEADTFKSSMGYVQYNEHEYFLVRTNLHDKEAILAVVDSFQNRHAPPKYEKLDNYTIYFYRESPELTDSLFGIMGDDYKLFLYNEDHLIMTCSYRNHQLTDRSYGTH